MKNKKQVRCEECVVGTINTKELKKTAKNQNGVDACAYANTPKKTSREFWIMKYARARRIKNEKDKTL